MRMRKYIDAHIKMGMGTSKSCRLILFDSQSFGGAMCLSNENLCWLVWRLFECNILKCLEMIEYIGIIHVHYSVVLHEENARQTILKLSK